MINKVLTLIKNNDAFAGRYQTALSTLYELKVLEFLHMYGRPRVIGVGSDTSAMAVQAARSAGYQDCLEDLANFLERFVHPEEKTKAPLPDYGGLDVALARGDLSKDEVYELKGIIDTAKPGPAGSNS